MKRRDFLKGLVGVSATLFLPKLISVPKLKRVSKFTLTDFDKTTLPEWDGNIFLKGELQEDITLKTMQDHYHKIMLEKIQLETNPKLILNSPGLANEIIKQLPNISVVIDENVPQNKVFLINQDAFVTNLYSEFGLLKKPYWGKSPFIELNNLPEVQCQIYK